MMKFDNVDIVQHSSNNIGLWMSEFDGHTTIITYCCLMRNEEEIYYLHNPICKIDGIDDV